MTRAGGIDPDELATLEEERSFLLRSLADLEREHEAGDVDDHDYTTLKDDYTSRAARVLRAIEAGRAVLPPRRPTDWRRVIIGAVVAVLAVALIGWALTRDTTDRRAGDTITGGPTGTDVNSMLVQARQLQTSDPLASIKLYEQVLAQEPENIEALTYRGWTAAFVALGLPEGPDRDVLVSSATSFLDRARAVDPTYPDAQCFTAIARFRFAGDSQGAKEPLERCREGDLPASVQSLVDALGASIDEALADGAGESDDQSATTVATSELIASTASTTAP
ncbi:MAG: hypothetical protein AB7Q42_20100 [Acidimicrobiia bacterium]